MMLVGVLFRPARTLSIVPGRETLVTVRILTRIDEDHGVVQSLAERRIIGGQELVKDLNASLEGGRFTPMNTVGEPHDDR